MKESPLKTEIFDKAEADVRRKEINSYTKIAYYRKHKGKYGMTVFSFHFSI